MKNKKLMAIILSSTMLITSGLVGCGSKTQDGNNSSSNGLDKDQYLNLVLGAEPKTLDPSKSSDSYSSQVLLEITEGLTRVEQDKDGKDVIKPAGAEKWEQSADGTVWTFKLRDYQWTDGKKVTAKDFEYGIKRTLNPKTGSRYAFLLSPIKNSTEFNAGKVTEDSVGVKSLDDKTLQITLRQPCPYFLDLTYFKVMLPQRQDMVEKYGEKFGSEAESLMACGPFTIKKWVHNSEVILEKNDKYWDKDSVKLSKVSMKIIKDQNARNNSLYNGSIDSLGVSKSEWIKKLDSTGKFNVIKGYDPSTNYNFFNTKDKLFSNANVRKAFSIALNREEMNNVIFHGINEAAYGWVPPLLQLGEKDFRKLVGEEPIKRLIKENPDPKALLIKGLKELGMNEDTSKLDVTMLFSGTEQWFRTYAEYIQQMYKKTLGINLKAEYVEWPIFQKRTEDMKYQIAGMGWSGDYNDPNTFFDMWTKDAGIVPTGWSNNKYDDLIKIGMKSMDQNERLKVYKEAENILLYEDAVIAPTAYRKRNTYRYKYVKNLMSPLFGSGVEFKYAYTQGRN